MIIKRLISPKWKHRNPDVRKKAINRLSSDDTDTLKQIFETETDPEIRFSAVQIVNTPELLEFIIENDDDQNVASAADEKLGQIFCDRILNAETDEERLRWLEKTVNQTLFPGLISSVESIRFRLAVIEKTTQPEILCRITEANCGNKAGEAVIAKTDDPEMLIRISTNATGKKIRRLAKEKAESFLKPAEKPAGENLKTGESDSDKINRLRTELESALTSNDSSSISKSIENGESMIAGLQQLPEELESIRALLAALKTHRDDIDAKKRQSEEINRLAEEIERFSAKKEVTESDLTAVRELEAKWASLDFAPPETTEAVSLNIKSFHSNYADSIRRKEERQAYLDQLEAYCREAGSLSEATAPEAIDKAISDLEKKWKTALKENMPDAEYRNRFSELISNLKNVRAEQTDKRRQKQKAEAERLIDFLESANSVEKNELFKTAQSVRDAVRSWSSLAITDIDLNNRFSSLTDRFFAKLDEWRETKDWEQWANLSLKTELCELVEGLAAAVKAPDINLFGLTDKVKTAQGRWRETGPVAKEKSDEIWERFRTACDTIYNKCLDEKKRLLEEVRSTTNGENFNEITKKVIDLQQQWKAIGFLPLSIEKEVKDEFQHLCDAFFEKKRLFFQEKESERLENLKIKTALCEQAETLSASPVTTDTTESFKKLQTDWKKTGPVPRNESDTLWNRFSTACNSYFDRFEESKPVNLTLKLEMITEAKSLLEAAENRNDIRDICRQAIDLQKQWQETGPVPKADSDRIWQEFRKTCDDIFAIRDSFETELAGTHESNREKKEALLIKAAEYQDSEDWNPATEALKKIQEEWKTIGPAARKEEQALWSEFRKINDDFFNRKRDHFASLDANRQSNLETKKGLCLTLELLAKAALDLPDLEIDPSLPVAEQLSMARDLRDSVILPGDPKGTRTNIMKKVREIRSEWQNTGPVPQDRDKALWDRFKKAENLFYKD